MKSNVSYDRSMRDRATTERKGLYTIDLIGAGKTPGKMGGRMTFQGPVTAEEYREILDFTLKLVGKRNRPERAALAATATGAATGAGRLPDGVGSHDDCPNCTGTGKWDPERQMRCSWCGGAGKLTYDRIRQLADLEGRIVLEDVAVVLWRKYQNQWKSIGHYMPLAENAERKLRAKDAALRAEAEARAKAEELVAALKKERGDQFERGVDLAERLERAEGERDEYVATAERANAIMDRSGVPSAVGAVCNDPECNSHVIHLIKWLLAERDALVAEVRGMRTWIPVAERLPEIGQRVLMFLPDQPERWRVNVGLYYALDGWRGPEWISVRPTHWMPLLKGPESPARAAAGGENWGAR